MYGELGNVAQVQGIIIYSLKEIYESVSPVSDKWTLIDVWRHDDLYQTNLKP
jgi:hypothetical protein